MLQSVTHRARPSFADNRSQHRNWVAIWQMGAQYSSLLAIGRMLPVWTVVVREFERARRSKKWPLG